MFRSAREARFGDMATITLATHPDGDLEASKPSYVSTSSVLEVLVIWTSLLYSQPFGAQTFQHIVVPSLDSLRLTIIMAALKYLFALALVGTVQVTQAHSSSARRATQRVCEVPNDTLVYIDGCDPNARTIDYLAGSTVVDLGKPMITCDDGSEACKVTAFLIPFCRLECRLSDANGLGLLWYSMRARFLVACLVLSAPCLQTFLTP